MKTHSKQKARRDRGRFISLPHNLLNSPDFLESSHPAKTALLALLYQYNGRNNGDLSLVFSRAKEWGIKSKSTLAHALKELTTKGIILRTRDPLRMRDNPHGQCALYAITWLAIDECGGKLDLAPTSAPLRSFTKTPRYQSESAT